MLTTAVIILGLATLGQVHRVAGQDIKPLDMAPDSVDDQYEGCREDMLKQVSDTSLKKEISLYTKKDWDDNQIITGQGHLTANHVKAILLYSKEVKVYTRFNEDTRTGRAHYFDKTYRWYLFHFLLTDAIQILNKQQKEAQTNCMTTYRGINVKFNENVNSDVRFGQIASSSTDPIVAQMFGSSESCFVIRTCEGADVSMYSHFGDEKEVLIPPYETFKVTEIRKNDMCKTVFYLESTGTQSNLNCGLDKVKVFLDSIKDSIKNRA